MGDSVGTYPFEENDVILVVAEHVDRALIKNRTMNVTGKRNTGEQNSEETQMVFVDGKNSEFGLVVTGDDATTVTSVGRLDGGDIDKNTGIRVQKECMDSALKKEYSSGAFLSSHTSNETANLTTVDNYATNGNALCEVSRSAAGSPSIAAINATYNDGSYALEAPDGESVLQPEVDFLDDLILKTPEAKCHENVSESSVSASFFKYEKSAAVAVTLSFDQEGAPSVNVVSVEDAAEDAEKTCLVLDNTKIGAQLDNTLKQGNLTASVNSSDGSDITVYIEGNNETSAGTSGVVYEESQELGGRDFDLVKTGGDLIVDNETLRTLSIANLSLEYADGENVTADISSTVILKTIQQKQGRHH